MDLEERVEQLEEKLGRLEEIVGQQVIDGPGRTVQGSLFQLTDAAGKVLAELEREYDSVALELSDGQQKSRASLSATKHGPMLTLDRLDCSGSIHLSLDQKGHQRMLFHNQAKPVFSLDTSAGMPSISLCDGLHRPRISLGVDLYNHPHIFLRDVDSQPGIIIGANDDHSFHVSFIDGLSKPRISLSLQGDADANLFGASSPDRIHAWCLDRSRNRELLAIGVLARVRARHEKLQCSSGKNRVPYSIK